VPDWHLQLEDVASSIRNLKEQVAVVIGFQRIV